MIIVIGHAKPIAGHREELIAACRMISEKTRQDAGCVSYSFHIGIDDPDSITNIEIWASQKHLDAHMNHEHTKDFLTKASSLTDGEPHMQIFSTTPGANS